MKQKIISIIRDNDAILKIASLLYNLFYLSLIRNKCQQGTSFGGAFLKKVSIRVKGSDNTVIIGKKTMMSNTNIIVAGNNCSLHIVGGRTNISNALIRVTGDNGSIYIDTGFTYNGGTMEACEGKSITIGKDCMFAGGVRISTTDHHSIIDVNSKERVNKAKGIHIGNHVWLARIVSVHKGTEISDDIIVGECSIVSGNLSTPHAIYVGCPAHKVKDNVTWSRKLL